MKHNPFLLACPTLNPGECFNDWLASLISQTNQPGEVFIIDSGSSDATQKKAINAGFTVKKIQKSQFNHGGTRQWAIDESEGYELVVFLTQDAILSSADSLSNIIHYFEDKNVAAVCGRQLPRKVAKPIEAHARFFNYPSQSYVRSIDDVKTFGLKTTFISNSFAAYRISALNKVVGFPDNVIFGEDMYVAAKMLKAGYKIAYAADACVYHSHDYTLLQEFRRYFDMGVFHASEPWLRKDFGAAEGEGLKFVRSEFSYLIKHAFWLIPEAILRKVFGYIGFRLGLLEKHLPFWLKRRLVMNKGFFKQKQGMNKKILFLSPFFYPEKISTGKYNSFLVGKLLESNYDVDVVAFHPFYPDWVISKNEESFKEAEIYRYGKNVRFPKSQILRRIILELTYAYYVSKHLFSHKKEYDIVISVFPPVLFMFVANIFLKKVLKVGIVHDVQGIMANTEKSFSRRAAAFLMGRVEKNIYKKCDRLICLSYSMKDEILKRYMVDEDKCEVFYPFVSLSEKKDNVGSGCLDDIFEDGFQHIVYSGALGEKQQPYDLYNFFQKLAVSLSSIKCHIFSQGPIFTELVSQANISSNNKVMFHDLVSESDVSEVFARSTVQVIPQSPGTGAGAFPS